LLRTKRAVHIHRLYLIHTAVAYRRSLVQRLGGFRAGFDGAEEYDLVLRCAVATEVNDRRRQGRPVQGLIIRENVGKEAFTTMSRKW
jgi:hypothetical protein